MGLICLKNKSIELDGFTIVVIENLVLVKTELSTCIFSTQFQSAIQPLPNQSYVKVMRQTMQSKTKTQSKQINKHKQHRQIHNKRWKRMAL